MSIAAAYDAYGHAICAGDLWGNDPLAGGCFGSVERLALRDLPDRHWERLKRWLYRCGVPFRQRVLVLPVVTTDSTPAVVPPGRGW